jgi:chloride channel 3/4/5
LKDHDFHGFPVVRRQGFLGFVTRDKLRLAIGKVPQPQAAYLMLTIEPAPLLSEDSEKSKRCVFSQQSSSSAEEQIDLSGLLEEAVLQLRQEVPKELVVNMFQKLVRSFE